MAILFNLLYFYQFLFRQNMFSPKLLLFLVFFLICGTEAAFAQRPANATLQVKKNLELRRVNINTKAGSVEEGFMYYYFPHSPEKEVSLIPLDGNLKKAVTYKVKDIESIHYSDLSYVQIIPENDRLEYLAREATTGNLSLYTFTEHVKAPVIVPVAGAVRAFSIPYDNSFFFIDNGAGIKKISRHNYQEELLDFVGSDENLARKIKDKTYKYRDIETIVLEYNAGASKL